MPHDTVPFFVRPVAGKPLWRHLCALGAILLCCLVLFLWAGYTFLPDAVDVSRREIINDTYSALTQPLTANGEIVQHVAGEGRLYGVVLDVTTYNRVARGTLHLRFLGPDGTELAACDTDMTALLDNTFHRFLFDAPIEMTEGTRYSIVLRCTPATSEDVIGFHRSEGVPQSHMAEGEDTPHYDISQLFADTDYYDLYQDAQAVDGMLALQFTTHYAGTFIVRGYSFFSAFLTVFLLLLYVLCFMLRAPIHRVFLVCALCLGFVFSFLIPPLAAPDEYAHIATAYHYSNVLLGTDEADNLSQIAVRSTDAGLTLDNYQPENIDIFAWQNIAENILASSPQSSGMEVIPARALFIFSPMLVFPTLGLTLGRLLGLGTYGILLLGRFANLLFYALAISRAIKRLPFAKGLLLCGGLLPMCLQLAASFSYDTYVIALGITFIASCLDYAFGRKGIGARQVLWLMLLAVLLAPAKYAYLLLLPFVIIIPAARYPSRRFCLSSRVGVLAAGLAVWLAFSYVSYVQSGGYGGPFAVAAPGGQAAAQEISVRQMTTRPADEPLIQASLPEAGGTEIRPTAMDPEMELEPNGDARQRFTPGYILAHLPKTLRVLARTVWEQTPLWLQGFIGGRLGEIIVTDIEINWVFVLALTVILFASALPSKEDNHVLSRRQRLGSGAIVLLVAAALVVTFLSWTPINYETIFGLQGRYLLPVLPLIFLAVRGSGLRFAKPVWRQLGFAAACFVVLCQLDAFLIILQIPVNH